MTSLAAQLPGTRCRVVHVQGTDPTSQRLMEMGLVHGTEVEVVKVAPLGDPMQITLLGYQLSIRKSEAGRVGVVR
jgi:ferrous iron transport protein A